MGNSSFKASPNVCNKLQCCYENYLAARSMEKWAEMIALQPAIDFNGGGHVQPLLFLKILPLLGQWGGETDHRSSSSSHRRVGSFEDFQAVFAAKTAAVQGSWLGLAWTDASAKRVVVETCANQDPLSSKGLKPLMGVDVGTCLLPSIQNVRPDYLKEIWV